jgi:hypothetical protein
MLWNPKFHDCVPKRPHYILNTVYIYIYIYIYISEHAVVSWLRHYATVRNVADSGPDEVKEFCFNLPNPSNCIGPWGLLSPLTEMSTSSGTITFLGSKAAAGA